MRHGDTQPLYFYKDVLSTSCIRLCIFYKDGDEYVPFYSDCIVAYALGKTLKTHVINLLENPNRLEKSKTICEQYTTETDFDFLLHAATERIEVLILF